MDAERLLGGFLRMGLGNGMKIGKKMKKLHKKGVNMGIGGGTQTALGMGVLGVAMAAFEHFTGQDQPSNAYPKPAAPSQSYIGSTTSPPPPPGSKPTSPPPPPPGAANKEQRNQEAIVLIRAAIAAANADGSIDAKERNRILDQFETAGLSDDERSFLLQELLSPASLETIADLAKTPELAKEIYAISLLTIDADTDMERTYLQNLAERLALDKETVQSIDKQFDSEQ